MPIYCHRCRKCGQEVEVIRKIVDSHLPPEPDEIPTTSEASQCEHDWEKLLDAGIGVARMPGWAGKGHWND